MRRVDRNSRSAGHMVELDEILPPENLHSPGSPWSKALLRFLALGDPQCPQRLSSQRAHSCPHGPVLLSFLHDPGLGSKEGDFIGWCWESMLHKLGALSRPGQASVTRVTPMQSVTAPCHGTPPLTGHTCALLYLAEFVEQFRNASQPLCGPLVVPILEHQLHHLRVPSADCLLQDWGHQAAEGCSLDGSRSGH